MTKDKIINYIMNTPENTNKYVLDSMLDELSNSNGGGGNPNYVETITGTLANPWGGC